MKKDRFGKPDETSRAHAPRKLHKPRRDLHEERPEQVIPYVDDCPADPGALEVGGE